MTSADPLRLPSTVKSFYAKNLFAGTAPVEGAFDALIQAKKLIPGLKFVVVTARGESERDGSQKWINEHFPGVFREMFFTGAL